MIEPFGQGQSDRPEADQQGTGAQHQACVQAQASSSPESLTGEIAGDPPAQAAHDDQHHHHAIDRQVGLVALEAVGPESEARVVVGRDAVKHGRPEALTGIGDVVEAISVEDGRAQKDHDGSGEGNAAEGGPHAADAEFIQGLSAVETSAQAGTTHHKAL